MNNMDLLYLKDSSSTFFIHCTTTQCSGSKYHRKDKRKPFAFPDSIEIASLKGLTLFRPSFFNRLEV